MEEKKSVFETLKAFDVSEHIEKKNGLSYVSWAWAWAELKKVYPNAYYTVYENKDGWNYFTDGRTGWVKTGVTVEGLEHIEYLPIMDYNNKSIPLDKITSFNVNTAIQRSLTKACARHGLGLYVYAGEDLPEEPKKEIKPISEEARKQAEEMNIGLDKLAIYFKKTVEELTDEDVLKAIELKKAELKKKGESNND